MFLPVTFGLLFIIVTIWIIWRKRKFSLFERYEIPGPKPHFLFGNLMAFNEKRKDVVLEWRKQYGKCYGFYLGAKPMLTICDAELLKMIQVKEFKTFSNRDPIIPDIGIAHSSLQKSVFALKNEEWKNTRNILTPAFTSGKLRKMMPTIQSSTEIFLKKISEKGNQPFDIIPLLKNLSFDVIGKISFGIDTNVQNNDSSIFIESIYRAFNTDTSDISALLSICFPELEPLPCMMRVFIDILRYNLNKSSVRTIVQTTKDIIKSRNLHPESRKPDLLQNMIDANAPSDSTQDDNQGNDEGERNENKSYTLSESTLIGNAFGFMVAGYEATTVVAGYFIYCLAKHPEVQEKLRNEINETLGDKEIATYEDISKMQYLDQVFSEVLRLTPLAPLGITRICEEEMKLKDITIPKGVCIIIPITMLNTDSEYWSQSTEFIPERFSPGNNYDPVQYQPFGVGPRICIGMRFAHLIIKQIIVNILRKYSFEYADKSKELEFYYSLFLMRPKHGIYLRAIPVK